MRKKPQVIGYWVPIGHWFLLPYNHFLNFSCFGMHATMFTATAILSERKEGILNRSLVMGVTSTEMMLAHIISDFPVMLLQFVLVYAVAFPILDFAIKGSLVLLIFFSILNGFCSLCGGEYLIRRAATHFA